MTILKDEFGITKNLPLNSKVTEPERAVKKFKSEIKASLNNPPNEENYSNEESNLMNGDENEEEAEVEKEDASKDAMDVIGADHTDFLQHNTTPDFTENSELMDKNENNKLNQEDI